MRYLLTGLLFIFCSACSNSDSSSGGIRIISPKAEGSKTGQGIPESVTQYLKANFTKWSIPNRDDYKIWWSFYEPRTMPYYAITDLNDDRQEDYAFVLKKPDSLSVVVLLKKGDTFTHWVADFKATYNPADKDIQFGLATEPPGQIDVVIPRIQSLILRSNAFTLMELENRRCIYYWSDGKISVFETK